MHNNYIKSKIKLKKIDRHQYGQWYNNNERFIRESYSLNLSVVEYSQTAGLGAEDQPCVDSAGTTDTQIHRRGNDIIIVTRGRERHP